MHIKQIMVHFGENMGMPICQTKKILKNDEKRTGRLRNLSVLVWGEGGGRERENSTGESIPHPIPFLFCP